MHPAYAEPHTVPELGQPFAPAPALAAQTDQLGEAEPDSNGSQVVQTQHQLAQLPQQNLVTCAPNAATTAGQQAWSSGQYYCDTFECNDLVEPHWAYANAGQLIQLQESGLISQALYQPAGQAGSQIIYEPVQQLQALQPLPPPPLPSPPPLLNQYQSQQLSPDAAAALFDPREQESRKQHSYCNQALNLTNEKRSAVAATARARIKTRFSKNQHNKVEQKRRVRILACCEQLKTMVPGLEPKTDKARVFEQTVRYVGHLKQCPGVTLCHCDLT